MTDAAPLPPLPGETSGRPYGMSNGPVRLAGINDQAGQRFAPPTPDTVDLDSPEANAPFAPSKPVPELTHTGWEVSDPNGRVVMNLPLNAGASQAYQAHQVTKAGKALLDNAVTPEERENATRATAWMLSRVGSDSVDNIIKEGVHRYDTDQGNATKVVVQGMKKRVPGGGGMGGGPAGPTKADKFSHQVNLDDAKFAEGLINNNETNSKLAALRDYESDLQKIDDALASKNPISQRSALMEYMKTLSGKQSTDVERRQIANAGGIIDRLKNDLSLWTEDPGLSAAYVRNFRQHMQTLRNAIAARKAQIGEETAQRVSQNPYFATKSEADRRALRNYAYGVITGNHHHEAEPTEAAPAASATKAAPKASPASAPAQGVDEDLL